MRAVQQQSGNFQISELARLVGHEGDERRDNDAESSEGDGGKLVTETLTGASRHHADDIVARENVGNDVALLGAEARKAKGAGEDLVD